MRVGPFQRVLVANRGEIAVRVIRACAELGLDTVAVFSEADREALHVRLATFAVGIGAPPSSESYLRQDKLLEVARRTGAEAVHPGYGFLSENATFARAVEDAGLVWIGPPPSAIEAMGSKTGARHLMEAAGVPVVPGTLDPITDPDELLQVAARVGYPVMLKAAAGGGGKGMRRVEDPSGLIRAFEAAQSESRRSFGDDAVYLEKFVVDPRHIEVQVMADAFGTTVHVLERDCSIQRRHQKVVEETPAPHLPQATREAICEVAVRAAKAVGYVGAGTVEFLYGGDGGFYFLEMNTRLQVEHPITEAVTGIDLCKTQLLVARGERLPFTQEEVRAHGHAIECRVYAEDPFQGFMPAPGRLSRYREPSGPFVRVDSGVYEGFEVPIHYDPMISKLVAWGRTRAEAIERMDRALREYRIGGIRTTIPFFRHVLRDPDFVQGRYTTGFITPERLAGMEEPRHEEAAAVIAAIAQYDTEHAPEVGGGPAGPTESAWNRTGRWSNTHRRPW